MIARVPDDAFYYLVLARNFAAGLGWTFDGISPASGFHLAWAYWLAACYKLFPDAGWQDLFVASGILGSACFATAAGLVAGTGHRIAGRLAPLGVALVFIAPSVARQSSLMMETPLVVLCGALCLAACVSQKRTHAGVLLLLGLAGMLARSDFGLLTACLLASALLARLVWKDAGQLRNASLLFIGAVVGLGATLAHTRLHTGGLIQASAQVKHHWATASGKTVVPSLTTAMQAGNPFSGLSGLSGTLAFGSVVVAAAVVMALIALARMPAPRRKDAGFAMLASGLAIAGYAVFYRENGAIQIWYLGEFLVPVAMVWSIAFSLVPPRLGMGGLAAILLMAVLAFRPSQSSIWPHQETMRRAGLFLAHEAGLAPAAAWNAGIVAYFAGRPVTNLDGLVNDKVVPFVLQGRLLSFMKTHGIRYLVDFPVMLTAERTHGFQRERLEQCLRPIRSLGDPQDPSAKFGGDVMWLYAVDGRCEA